MTKDLTRGTPWKLIVQFALPIMAGNLLQQLYNTPPTPSLSAISTASRRWPPWAPARR